MPTHASPEFLSLQAEVAGRYSLEREMGRGGMGVVFLARDVALDRLVAIKLLPPHLAASPEARERFLREARTAGRLTHPNIVPIHAVEERGDLVYFVMAYVNGESLGDRIRRRGALPTSHVVRVIQEAAWALAYAHNEGVVHRDIKPDNILIESGSGRSLLADFGIARVAEADSMTGKGELVGTVHYMSPEQATGERVDGRSDLYSLGVTAYHALTGTLPFDGTNLPALIHQHVNQPPPRVAVVAPRVPPRVAEAVDCCLSKDPEQRFKTADDLATAVSADVSVRKQVPPEVRSLLRHLRETGIVIGTAGGVIGYTTFAFTDAILGVVQQAIAEDAAAVVFVLVLILGGLVSYPIRLMSMIRRAIRTGLGLADVRTALHDEARALDEEMELDDERKKRRAARRVLGMPVFQDKSAGALKEGREKWIRRGPTLIKTGIAFLVLILFPTLLDVGLGEPVNFEALFAVIPFAILTAAGVLLVGAGPTVNESSPLRALPVAERLLVGRLGEFLFRLAGIGIAQPKAAEPVDQLTEAFLASAVDEIFDRLPEDVQRRFHEVPALIERLESVAKDLRTREEALSRAVAEVAPTAAPRSDLASGRRAVVSDLEAERDLTRERLEAAVTALENLRLDLLRLEVGVCSADDLTATLAKARDIGEAIEQRTAE